MRFNLAKLDREKTIVGAYYSGTIVWLNAALTPRRWSSSRVVWTT